MSFAICLMLVTAVCFTSDRFIKKNANLLYGISALISVLVIVCTALRLSNQFPQWFRIGVWNPLAWGTFSTAIFAVVMFTGAFRQGSPAIKKLMPIRRELSIIASILTLGHNFSAGQIYFVLLFTEPSKLTGNQLFAAICSLIMLGIMIPLFVTSFPGIRRKMSAKSWKRLQRSAYVFYGLIYVHVLLLNLPKARSGQMNSGINIGIFSVVFLVYGAMRLQKLLCKRWEKLKYIPAAVAVLLALVVGRISIPQQNRVRVMEASTVARAMEEEVVEEDRNRKQEPEIEKIEEDKKEEKKIEKKKKPAKKESFLKKEEEKGKLKEVIETSTEEKAAPPVEREKKAPEKKIQEKQKDKKEKDKEQENKEQEKEEKKKETDTVDLKKEITEPVQPKYKYKNGSFSGSGEGFGGTITVNVTIKDDAITEIKVISHKDDEPFWSEGATIIDRILSSQSTNVDTVSGATFSSGGIKEAVSAALSSAKNE